MKEINTMNRGVQKKPAARKPIVTSVALAVAIMAGGLSFSAQALILGQARVNSALGEPFKAEIPITQLTADEASSLQVKLATSADYGSRGLIYSSVISSIRVSYEVTGKDTAVIKITSMRPMQEPFIDLLMDVRWRAGSMQRSYTMLIDPPKSIRTASNTPSTSTEVSVLQQPVTSKAGNVVISERIMAPSERIVLPGEQTTASGTSTTLVTSNTQRPTQQTQTRDLAATGSDLSMTVARGQTLGQIAALMKPADVTTEQMLAALYRANPSAFIKNNINWVRAGATLRIPSESEVAAVNKAEARSIVSAHAREFNEYRTRVAQGTTTVKPVADTGGRAHGGEVKPRQEQDASSTQTDNQLQITTGEQADLQTGMTTAQQQAQEDMARQAEIDKNKAELSGLANSIGATSTSATTPEAGDPAIQLGAEGKKEQTASEPLVVDAHDNATSPADVSAKEPATIDEPPATIDEPPATIDEPPATIDEPPATIDEPPAAVDEEPVEVKAPAPTVPLEKGFVDQLLDNPLIPLAGAGVFIALIGGIFVIRRRRNSQRDEFYADDEFDENVSADSFFADNHSQGTDSHMLDQSSSIYAASQLDTNADVDPVQEADVYLAYGRDEQAAEILRDALQSEPNRIALHAKLCEVYARQNNPLAFDEQASQLRALTSGKGPEWGRIVRLAQSISPDNPLYSDVVETQNLSGFASQFTPSGAPQEEVAETHSLKDPENDLELAEDVPPVAQQAKDAFKASDISLELPGADDTFGASGSDSAPFMLNEDDEGGPTTRLALAEEFFAIGNTKDAKEIAEEVLKQDTTAEVKKRAASLLDKVL